VTNVLKAKETLERLEADLAKATDRAIALQVERRKLSFAAHGDADAKATKELDRLTAESVTVGLSADNIKAAIDEARSRLLEAQRAADLAQRKLDARKVRELGAHIRKHGPVISAALDTLRDSFVALIGDLRAARELGCEIVPSRLVEIAFAQVVSHTLRPAGLDLGDMVPPAQRHEAASLTDSYARRANDWADGVLAGEKVAA
jgi:hypothetical protein